MRDRSDLETLQLRRFFTVRKEDPAVVNEHWLLAKMGKGGPIVDARDRREFFNADFAGVFQFQRTVS